MGDELATLLHDVTFVVVDLETTGCSPADCGITEIGALRLRGGECLGEFQTLVNPGTPVAPAVSRLTGITDSMLEPAPTIGGVVAAWLEFARGAVLVGHNVRFDIAFLDAACEAHGFPHLEHHRVDTLRLARRLVQEDVPNLRLATVADHVHARTEPIHRALEDARATADVLHAMLELLGTIGVLRLAELLEFPDRPRTKPKPYDGRRLVARRDP